MAASDEAPPAIEFTDEGKINDETVATLVEDLEKLAINPECSLYQPTSSQEDTSDDTSSQATCGSGSHPPDKPADDGKKTALERFMDLSGIGPLGSIMERAWKCATTKTQDHYTCKASEIIASVIKTVAPDSAPQLWEAVRTKGKVSQFLQMPRPDNGLVQAIVESYKLAEKAETRYEFTAARRYALEVGAGLPVLAPSVKQTRERVDPTKLEHFLDFITSSNIVQDLPFGRRTLTLSSGEKIDIPNVIRTMLPSHLIRQYNQYCSEEDFIPLSTRTLFRILSEACVASVRKSLQGLDSYAAEGGRGFDDLTSLLDTLMQYGANDPEIHKLKDSLKHLKQYIKSDYKIHCSMVSYVPDHCRVFALSDPKKKCFHRRCDHHHNQQCESCEILKTSLDLVKSFIQSTNLPEDVQDDALFTARTACDAVLSWKSHQLRMVHQDVARSDAIDSLGEDSTLITQDFAMKFLPAQYRETQAEFFGKRGISWHLTVCQSNKGGKIVAQTFVHIIESGVQDSNTVVSVMEHVLQTLKCENPTLNRVVYRQDNAGCYHSATTILACKILRERSSLDLRRIDFCDPQGGKGPCDRKAAQIKTHVKQYINQGNSVTTPAELKKAIESNGGIKGVRVTMVPVPKIAGRKKIKWDGISSLSNFEITSAGVRSFKAYGIGAGHFQSWTSFK
ncbi:Hypothetical predicted protein, partial [Paramuricea clavata]